jgi:trans-aconitate 2-methyltransferase
MWDPRQYHQFADERSRPFFELIARIGATEPGFVTDLGCGTGELTARLSERWPGAQVVGVDSSPEMISAARPDPPALRFERADVRAWTPARPADVIVSNAVLQWIPGHEPLVAGWVKALADGGWLACQLPANADQPANVLLRELIGSDRWHPLLAGVELSWQSAEPARYLDLLAGAGCQVDAWETTYSQVLHGDDAVLRWISGTGLRPVITALAEGQREDFLAEFGELLRAEYPRTDHGTVFPFRRVFFVAQVR